MCKFASPTIVYDIFDTLPLTRAGGGFFALKVFR